MQRIVVVILLFSMIGQVLFSFFQQANIALIRQIKWQRLEGKTFSLCISKTQISSGEAVFVDHGKELLMHGEYYDIKNTQYTAQDHVVLEVAHDKLETQLQNGHKNTNKIKYKLLPSFDFMAPSLVDCQLPIVDTPIRSTSEQYIQNYSFLFINHPLKPPSMA